MTTLYQWAQRGMRFTINPDGTLQPSRKWLDAYEAGAAKAQKEEILTALLGQWEQALVAAAATWAADNGYSAIIRWGKVKLIVQPNVDHCAFPGHEDRKQQQHLAVCDECAVFNRTRTTVIDFETHQELVPAPTKSA